ncbi:trypsin epsilon-like [Topomyia yanbarensis]|uniref:trypsin epsilon-like n=1 Tax=Topomyia yanbarensis TaxID=2498891 RepID=UPI00273CA500|nr:trypsin epsilon-like [Topomyia yanbarensis]
MNLLLALLLMTFIIIEAKKLTVEEALTHINRVPAAIQNVISRRTNSVHHQHKYSEIQNSTRIIGGTETTIEEYPYQVALLYQNQQICGGSIVAHSWVLTAAHCLDWYPPISDTTIRTGSTSRSSGGTVHSIHYYHIHEQNEWFDVRYDVATIRVKLPFSDAARAIIPLANTEWVDGTDAIITGWGVNEHGETPDKLHMVAVPVVDRSICNEKWDGLITDDMICAGDMGIGSCRGDSGGPAVQLNTLHGIVSWGPYDCGIGLPVIYTNVAHPSIRSFIKRTTGV